MTVVLALLRKQLVETRWVIGLSSAAFYGLAILTTWVVKRYERAVDANDLTRVARFRFLRALGGEAMDYSSTAMQVCWWNHPVIVLTILSWAIARGSAAVAGEIERGTVDVTLSRPVSRSTYLATQTAFAVLGLLALAAVLVAGDLTGQLIYGLKQPPTLMTLCRPALTVVALGMAVYGYTLPFSALDVVRWRPTLAASALTLGGLISLTVAAQFETYQKVLERLSVFQAYAPVTVAVRGEPFAYNSGVLLLIFAAGFVASLVVFNRRDLPSNS